MSPTKGSSTRTYSPLAVGAERLMEVDSPMTARSPAQNRVMAARLAAVGSDGFPMFRASARPSRPIPTAMASTTLRMR